MSFAFWFCCEVGGTNVLMNTSAVQCQHAYNETRVSGADGDKSQGRVLTLMMGSR